MGRYYSGDINGKFWFGVQSSNDADFFGSSGEEPNHLNYYFDADNLPEVEKGIKQCEKELGEYKAKLDKFFKENNGYNDEKLSKAIGADLDGTKRLLKWYARHGLGVEIKKCIVKNGKCEFDAEL
jgi:hypothetical protein